MVHSRPRRFIGKKSVFVSCKQIDVPFKGYSETRRPLLGRGYAMTKEDLQIENLGQFAKKRCLILNGMTA
jgi:hypothetical protein